MYYAELVTFSRQMALFDKQKNNREWSTHDDVADAIEALIRERDSLLSPELFREHYQRGYRVGLEKAADNCVDANCECRIRALIQE